MILFYFLRNLKDGFLYWTDITNVSDHQSIYGKKNSADLEITSYVLLAKLHNFKTDEIDKTIQIAKWINSQRNSLGGFYSTQVFNL